MTTINHVIQSGSGWEQLPTLQSRTFQNITSGVDSIRVKIQDDIPAFDDKGIEIPYGEKLTLDSLLVGVWVLRKATFNIVIVETPTIDGGLSPEDQEKLAGALQTSGANTMLSTYEASVDNPDGVVSAKTISEVLPFELLEKYDYAGDANDNYFIQGCMNSNYHVGGSSQKGTIGIHRVSGAEKVVTTSFDPVTSLGEWDILYDIKTDVTLISGHDYIGLLDSNLDEVVTMQVNIASGGTVDYHYDGHNNLRLLSLTDSFVVVVMDSDNCIIVFDRADGSVVKVINDTWTNPPSVVATDNTIITSLEDHSGFRMMDIDGTNQTTITLDESIQDFGYRFHVDEENNRFFGIGMNAPILVFALDTGIKETEIAIPYQFNDNNFGMSFAYNSKTIVFGDHGFGSQDEGAFSLFNRETLALELVHTELYRGYGRSVGIDENVVMIGNPGVNTSTGGYITYKLPITTLLDAEYHKERESYVDAELLTKAQIVDTAAIKTVASEESVDPASFDFPNLVDAVKWANSQHFITVLRLRYAVEFVLEDGTHYTNSDTDLVSSLPLGLNCPMRLCSASGIKENVVIKPRDTTPAYHTAISSFGYVSTRDVTITAEGASNIMLIDVVSGEFSALFSAIDGRGTHWAVMGRTGTSFRLSYASEFRNVAKYGFLFLEGSIISLNDTIIDGGGKKLFVYDNYTVTIADCTLSNISEFMSTKSENLKIMANHNNTWNWNTVNISQEIDYLQPDGTQIVINEPLIQHQAPHTVVVSGLVPYAMHIDKYKDFDVSFNHPPGNMDPDILTVSSYLNDKKILQVGTLKINQRPSSEDNGHFEVEFDSFCDLIQGFTEDDLKTNPLWLQDGAIAIIGYRVISISRIQLTLEYLGV